MDYPRISSCNKVPRFVTQRLMAIAKVASLCGNPILSLG